MLFLLPMKFLQEIYIQKVLFFAYTAILGDRLDTCKCSLNHNFLSILLLILMVVYLCILYKDNTFYSFFFMNMKTNEWMNDRLIRLVIAVVVLVGWYLWLQWTVQIIAYVVGVLALITSITGFCGLYTLLKINTCKVKSKKK